MTEETALQAVTDDAADLRTKLAETELGLRDLKEELALARAATAAAEAEVADRERQMIYFRQGVEKMQELLRPLVIEADQGWIDTLTRIAAGYADMTAQRRELARVSADALGVASILNSPAQDMAEVVAQRNELARSIALLPTPPASGPQDRVAWVLAQLEAWRKFQAEEVPRLLRLAGVNKRCAMPACDGDPGAGLYCGRVHPAPRATEGFR